MVIQLPECDIRPWLRENEGRVHPYTRQRISQSYPFIDNLLSRHEDIRAATAYDVGCGAGYDTFAIGRYFDHVRAIDVNRRAIQEARAIAKGAGISHIAFKRANIEGGHAEHQFDFVYCNLMSHNVASRCALVRTLRKAMKPSAYLLYSEMTEGYAPMEIHRAIVGRDQGQLVSRIWQVLSGVTGQPAFRFFLAGSALPLLEANKLCLMAHEVQTWNGMKTFERITAKAEGGTAVQVMSWDADYLDIPAAFAELRAQCSDMFSTRPKGGFSSTQRSRLEALAESARGRYAPFLLFLLMADIVVASASRGLSLFRRLRRVHRREPWWFGLDPSDLARRDTVDWAALEELDLRFIQIMRRNSGMPADSIDG